MATYQGLRFYLFLVFHQNIISLVLGNENLTLIPLIIKNHFSTVTGAHLYLCKHTDLLLLMKSQLNVPTSYNLLDRKYSSARDVGVTFQKSQVVGVYLDMTCANGKDFLQQSLTKFNGSYVWLIRVSKPSYVLQILKESRLSTDSQVTLAIFSDNRGIKLLDLFRMHANLPFTMTEIAFLNISGNYEYLDALPQRNNFQGVHFFGSIVVGEFPLKYAADYQNSTFMPGVAVFPRYTSSLLTVISKALNYSYKYIPAFTWGYPLSNGSWSGMIGQIQSGTVEMGLSSVVHTEGRLNVVDFTMPVHDLRTCFTFKQPPVFGSFASLIRPLNGVVWCALGLFIIVTPVILKITTYCQAEIFPNQSFALCFFMLLSALSQQGIPEGDSKDSINLRITVLFLLLCTYFTSVFYNSALLYFLILPSPKAIQNIHQLFASDFQIGIQDSPFFEYELTWNDTLSLQLRGKIDKSKTYNFSPIEGGWKIKKEKFAYYHFDNYLDVLIPEIFSAVEICSLTEVMKNKPFRTAAAVGKNSPYKETINKKLLLLGEHGIKNHLLLEWQPKPPECNWKLDAFAIGIEPLLLTFVILWFGIAISAMILFTEIFFFRSAKVNLKTREDVA